jgi:hypothetical protein
MADPRRRPPVSTRRALALALDLALRRDPRHSLIVPVLLRAPWVLTLALLPPFESFADPAPVVVLASVALVGDFVTSLLIGAMLRFRARSVFEAGPGAAPGPARASYALGIRRIPWLLVTEVLRNFTLGLAASFSVLPVAFLRIGGDTFLQDVPRNALLLGLAAVLLVPTVFLSLRLAVATEAVVLHERDLAGAFLRSFRLMEERMERWFELVAASAAMILGAALFSTALGVLVPAITDRWQVATFWLLVVAIVPVIHYAWTFFYLRLVEVAESAPEAAATPGPVVTRGAARPPLEFARGPQAPSGDGGNGAEP